MSESPNQDHSNCVEKGMSIFHDIFRRADKNDDGAICWDEFRGYFADGLLSHEELSAIFHNIDTHKTNNIDTGELCNFFGERLADWKAVFSALEDLSATSSAALRSTSASYQNASHADQFVTRFLLREVSSQLVALHNILDNANEAIEEKAKAQRPSVEPILANNVYNDDIGPLVCVGSGRRYRRQMSAPGSCGHTIGGPFMEAGDTRLQSQVEKLERLIHQMESNIRFEGIRKKRVREDDEKLILVVCRKIDVDEEKKNEFRAALHTYMHDLNTMDACLHVGMRCFAEQDNLVLYELWESDQEWKRLAGTEQVRKFMHTVVDCSKIPQSVSAILLPSEWFKVS